MINPEGDPVTVNARITKKYKEDNRLPVHVGRSLKIVANISSLKRESQKRRI
jgi:hypothetical protein